MLSDKEKKAFESVKDMFSDVTIKDIDEQSITIYGVAMLDVIKVLTIVEKQEKEIEELNKSDESKEQSSMKYYNLYRELVDKIKAKIEELEREKDEYEDTPEWELFDYLGGQIEILQSLLEKE